MKNIEQLTIFLQFMTIVVCLTSAELLLVSYIVNKMDPDLVS